jgi:hypothetical protein
MALSNKKIILILVGVGFLLILVVGGFIGGIFWIVWEATSEPVRVTREHLAATTREDYEAAYGYLSPALQAELPFEAFTELARNNPQVYKVSDTTFSNRNINNDVCTLLGSVTSVDGGKTSLRVVLVSEGGQWRIREFRWGGGAGEEVF